MEVSKRVLVVGAGITGLSLAYWLRKKNRPVVIAEAGNRAGGVMDTLQHNGFELDLGPVTCSLTPALEQLVTELNLHDKVLKPAPAARFLYSNKKIHPVEPSLPKLLFHPMLSWRGRLGLLKDLFVKPGARPDESVHAFAARHFGQEAAEKLFDPVLGGIYAGNYNTLSIQATLPMLTNLEQAHGSVIKGLIKNQKQLAQQKRVIVNLAGGFRTLIDALAEACGDALRLNHGVQYLRKVNNRYEVEFSTGTTDVFDEVYFTTPAFTTGALIKPLDPVASELLTNLPYTSLHQVYCEVDSAHSFNGFGFLVPSRERLSLLGAIQVSHLFPQKSLPGKSLFILFCGGHRPYPFEAHVAECVTEFNSILNVQARTLHVQSWQQAIPQPTVGYAQALSALAQFEQHHAGLHLVGSYRGGVAVGDRVKFAQALAEQA